MLKGFVRLILILTGVVGVGFGLAPIFTQNTIGLGTAALLVLGACCIALSFLLHDIGYTRSPWEVLAGKGRYTIIARRLLILLLTLFMLVSTPLSIMMVNASRNTPLAEGQADTAVVLGCLVVDGRPGLELSGRLEQALQYLERNPAAMVVVTGAQGRRETTTEAAVEAAWLIERGIAQERIIIEDRSYNTSQNLSNTAALLAEAGLPNSIVIFTDGYHQMRSQLYAGMYGLTARGISARTPWWLLPGDWLREQAALVKAFYEVWRAGTLFG